MRRRRAAAFAFRRICFGLFQADDPQIFGVPARGECARAEIPSLARTVKTYRQGAVFKGVIADIFYVCAYNHAARRTVLKGKFADRLYAVGQDHFRHLSAFEGVCRHACEMLQGGEIRRLARMAGEEERFLTVCLHAVRLYQTAAVHIIGKAAVFNAHVGERGAV